VSLLCRAATRCALPRFSFKSPAALLLRGSTIATRCCPAHPLPRSTNASGPKTFWLAWFSRQSIVPVPSLCYANCTACQWESAFHTRWCSSRTRRTSCRRQTIVPHAAAAPPCANQVAAVLRRTPTACSANPDQHRQAGFQRHCTINVERSTELRSPKWQLGHLQIKTENRTVYNSLWLLGRNVTSPSASVPT